MKVYTVKDLETFERDEHGSLICPSGDYTQIKSFGDNCIFGEWCIFGDNCSFGEWCLFGESCSFKERCSFGKWCSFGENCSFEKWCSFGRGCSFGEGCRFEINQNDLHSFELKVVKTLEIVPNNIYLGDCLDLLQYIPDKSIDMILCDLPYGITACGWDFVIPLNCLWEQYKRIIKDNAAIVLTASQPFTSMLVMSNLEMFKCEWIYKKRCASNFAQAKYMPMKEHESVLVFARGRVNYYPIKEKRVGSGIERSKYIYTEKSRHKCGEFVGKIKGDYDKKHDSGNDELRYPSSVQEFNNRAKGDRGLHPTQKPLALFEYFIKTYSKEGDLVLDNCIGSGTTAIACLKNNRRYIGFENNPKYYETALKRINDYKSQLNKAQNFKDITSIEQISMFD